MAKEIKCECGNSMVNKAKSTANWIVYDCVCSACGNRSEKAAAAIRKAVLNGVLKKGKR